MAYDEGLAQRVREQFGNRNGIVEKRMFGGLAFLVRGHMACGIVGHMLMVRTGPEAYSRALTEPHTREMDFTGRALRGFVYVAPEGLERDEVLGEWVRQGADFAASLPPKPGEN